MNFNEIKAQIGLLREISQSLMADLEQISMTELAASLVPGLILLGIVTAAVFGLCNALLGCQLRYVWYFLGAAAIGLWVGAWLREYREYGQAAAWCSAGLCFVLLALLWRIGPGVVSFGFAVYLLARLGVPLGAALALGLLAGLAALALPRAVTAAAAGVGGAKLFADASVWSLPFLGTWQFPGEGLMKLAGEHPGVCFAALAMVGLLLQTTLCGFSAGKKQEQKTEAGSQGNH